jgi:acetyl/propionyl-CoA carboxylase alpha subunit
MRRALAEYDVRGIKTTLPFFRWVLNDADFLAGRFDTGFIDRKLGARNGQPLLETTEEHEEIAAITAALSQTLRALDQSSSATAPVSRWAQQARADALRTSPPSFPTAPRPWVLMGR